MDDDDRKFPRKSRQGPAAPRSRAAGAGRGKAEGGKPALAAKKKPFIKRRDDAGGAERPKRDFRDGARPATVEGDRPFNKGPRPAGKPFVKRDGPRKPYTPREGRPMTADGERGEKRFDRPKRDFGRDAGKPGNAGGFKPRPRPTEAEEAVGERIAKRLARAGLASRRDAEELIAAGRVKVNGKALTSPAFNVMPNDIIHLDGMEIPPIERTRLFLFNKPAGVVTTNRDPQGRKTVFDVLPDDLPRLLTVGRLDITTEGLLLLTNDGGLSRVLELPATGWLRRYRARVHGKVEESALAGLREGIAVDGVFYGAVEATLDREQGSNAWLTLGLREGKNREVKNILGALGLDVTRLIRISYGPFQLSELAEGHVLEVNGRMLRDQLGERLIEESGANFDAEIVKPFSNRPVRGTDRQPQDPDRPKPTREGDRRPIGEGGLIKNRKRRENSRDEALGKLSTRPERESGKEGPRPERSGFAGRSDRPDRPAFGKPPRGGKNSEREQRPLDPPGQRKANVWMASGARPIGKGRAEAEKAEADARKERKQSFAKPGGAKPFGKPHGDRPGAKGGDRPRGRPSGKAPGKGPKAR